MTNALLPADRQLIVYERFTARLRKELRGLVSEDLIDEHRRKPLGQHSDGLERVLNFFRRPPSYGLYARVPCREWQVVRLPVDPGSDPQPADSTVYTDENEAMHAVFLMHVADLMRDSGE